MAILKKGELEDLQYFAYSTKEIVELIKEKKETLAKLYNKQSSGFQTLYPAPKPKGDIKFTSEKELNKGLKKLQSKIIEDTKNSYDDKIDKLARENINTYGYDHHKEKMDGLSKKEIVVLVEDGPDAVLDMQKEQKDKSSKEEKAKNQNKGTTLEQSIKTSEEKSKEIFGDLEKEQEIPNLEEKEINHDKNIEQNIKMDKEESEKTFDHQQGFKDTSKDISIDKRPSPSNDFE